MDTANRMGVRFPGRITDAVRDAVSRLQDLARRDSYQPERHYMRGPGPKCRAKGMCGDGPNRGDVD